MTHTTGRLALAEERVRIETARSSLRTSALWLATIAFVIPAMLSCVVLIAMLVNDPGPWYEVLLLSVVQVVVIGAVFSVPIWFYGGFGVITLDRRLRRDAAAGWPIERVRGDVVWSRRRRGVVAAANGRPLASPFFTNLNALPAYWDHFDRLAPGSYELELLRESGLVLSATPCRGADAPTRDQEPGNVALRAAFRSSLDDMASNRRGVATGAQRLRLLVVNAWLLPALGGFGYATTLAVRGAIESPHAGSILGTLIPAGLTLLLAYLAFRVALDVARGKLESGAGRVQLTAQAKGQTSGTVGGMKFTVALSRARALQIGINYRVYAFKHSRQVVSAELA